MILLAYDLTRRLTSCAASVDYETDAKIQKTIATEFKERTILCIARKFQLTHSLCLADQLCRSSAHGHILRSYLCPRRRHDHRRVFWFLCRDVVEKD